jgi:hypothetical protein
MNIAARSAAGPLSLVLVLMLGGCPADPSIPDAPLPDGGPARACTGDADCDDGLYCTGEESCVAGLCVRGGDPCDDGIACTIDSCNEARLRCTSLPPDEDGDGAYDDSCLDAEGAPLGDDCDDDDVSRFPGNTEVCDAVDQDCDPTTLGDRDDDGDGYVSATCCDGTRCGEDCDDARIGSFPGATEVCDGLDQDCDGDVDDGLLIDSFVDRDSDGWGAGEVVARCPGAPGHASRSGDCNDDPEDEDARAQNPGQPEICDGIRNDCTALPADEGAGAVDWYTDVDGDGFGAPASGVTRSCEPVPSASLLGTDCNDAVASIHPGAAEQCNGVDDDCYNGADFRLGPNDFEDDDGDGLIDVACAPLGTDCDDTDPASGPGEPERCDLRDNDCDSVVDEGATEVTYYRDRDRDGFGSIASGSVVACMLVAGFTTEAGDCNDDDDRRFPFATETCDGADEDCDSAVDETPASSACMPANASASTCVSGRCEVDGCVAPFEDCDGRPANGCEADLSSDSLSCGFCGDRCVAGGGCAGGNCIRSLASTISGVRPRTAVYQIDTAVDGTMISYTRDGSFPTLGAASTTTVPAPVRLVLGGNVTIRWRAHYPGGVTEDVQSFAHALNSGINATAPISNHGAIVEDVDINGQGSVALVAPGATIELSYTAQFWHGSAAGACPTCEVFVGITRQTDGDLVIAQCSEEITATYPGVRGLRELTFTAPTAPGRYAIYQRLSTTGACTLGTGPEIGAIVVSR